jgi:hypothetical protein
MGAAESAVEGVGECGQQLRNIRVFPCANRLKSPAAIRANVRLRRVDFMSAHWISTSDAAEHATS